MSNELEFTAPDSDDLPAFPTESFSPSSSLQEFPLPAKLTLEEAYRATVFFAQQYLSLEKNPDPGLVLQYQYMLTDPAASSDWTDAVRRVVQQQKLKARGSVEKPD